ncbi:hypothetical protein OSTOST_06756 [Ostertagia ostertagi]
MDDLDRELQLFELERQAAMDAISNTLQGITGRLDTLYAMVAEMKDDIRTGQCRWTLSPDVAIATQTPSPEQCEFLNFIFALGVSAQSMALWHARCHVISVALVVPYSSTAAHTSSPIRCCCCLSVAAYSSAAACLPSPSRRSAPSCVSIVAYSSAAA